MHGSLLLSSIALLSYSPVDEINRLPENNEGWATAEAMTAKDLLEMNGDFRHSPLLDSARKLHRLLTPKAIPYVIIGGLSVIRNGAVRTTQDVDVLVRKQDWPEIRKSLKGDFATGIDNAVDRSNKVQVDFLFAGDDWDMIMPLPDPIQVSEFDQTMQANFLSLAGILELKTAVYLQKKRDEGIEIAAKDLADVVELLRNNQDRLSARLFDDLHPVIRKELERILRKIRKGKRR
jgi:hypothetical protein